MECYSLKEVKVIILLGNLFCLVISPCLIWQIKHVIKHAKRVQKFWRRLFKKIVLYCIGNNMEITYDPKADVLNLTFKKSKFAKTIELAQFIWKLLGLAKKIEEKRISEVLMKNLIFTK